MRRKQIVILHGWGASVDKLKPLQQNLNQLGWEVCLPQLPGFDLPNPPEAWGLDQYATFVRQKARDCFENQNYYVFGHSFGGRIAIKIALSDDNNLQGVVLCATGGLSRPWVVKRMALLFLAKTGGKVLSFFPVEKSGDMYKKLLYKLSREHDYEKADNKMKQVLQKVVNEDLKPMVEKIISPTLILWGDKDKMTPYRDALYLKKHIKNAKLYTFADQGHTLPYKKYQQIAEKINKWATG